VYYYLFIQDFQSNMLIIIILSNLFILSNTMPVNYLTYCHEYYSKCSKIEEIHIPNVPRSKCNITSFYDFTQNVRINKTLSDSQIIDVMKIKNCSKLWIKANGSYKFFENPKQSRSNIGHSFKNNIPYKMIHLFIFLYCIKVSINITVNKLILSLHFHFINFRFKNG